MNIIISGYVDNRYINAVTNKIIMNKLDQLNGGRALGEVPSLLLYFNNYKILCNFQEEFHNYNVLLGCTYQVI